MSTGTKGERNTKATRRRERGWRARTAVFAGAALVAALSPSPADAAVGDFSSAGSITTARVSHATVLLTTDEVLTFGGFDGAGNVLSSSAKYTPGGTGAWATSASLTLQTARFDHTGTALDGGEALAVGGRDSSGAVKSIELYTSGSWVQSVPSCGTTRSASCPEPLITARYDHTATRLLNGKVLIVGGRNSLGAMTNSVELYDPTNGEVTPAQAMSEMRAGHTATLLPDGKVLVVGGEKLVPVPEVYDPAATINELKWTRTGPMAYGGRQGHTATVLADGACLGTSPPLYCGKVLVTGGANITDSIGQVRISEIYDIVENAWTETAPLNKGRSGHAATLLANGKVLVTGGWGQGPAFAAPEVYNPALPGEWSMPPPPPPNPPSTAECSDSAKCLADGRLHHTATRLKFAPTSTSSHPNDVIIVGGRSEGTYHTSAERYDA